MIGKDLEERIRLKKREFYINIVSRGQQETGIGETVAEKEKKKKLSFYFPVQKDTCLHRSKCKGEKNTLTSVGHSSSMNIKKIHRNIRQVKNETELFFFKQPSLIQTIQLGRRTEC